MRDNNRLDDYPKTSEPRQGYSLQYTTVEERKEVDASAQPVSCVVYGKWVPIGGGLATRKLPQDPGDRDQTCIIRDRRGGGVVKRKAITLAK